MATSSSTSTDESDAAARSKSDLPPYLMTRKGVYYFKRRIPPSVARTLGLTATQVWKSLQTSDLDTALKKLAVELREFDSMVVSATKKRAAGRSGKATAAPRGKGTTKYLLAAHLPSLLSRFEYGLLSTDDEERREMSREQRAERLQMLEEGLTYLYDAAAGEDYSSMEEVAQQLLEIERLIAPPGSKVREQLLKELLAKDIEVMELQRDRLKGKVKLTPLELPMAPRSLPTLLDVHAAWRRKQTEVRTIETYESFVAEFESVVGALPVVALTSEHANAYRDYLVERGLARETIRNRLGGLGTIVRYGCSIALCATDRNPFDGINLDAIPARPAHEERRAYEPSELVQLFGSAMYVAERQVRGQAAESSYWAPLLGPFVGARIEEITQLRVEDVQCINGVWALRICNLDSEQKLKTETSYRWVPLHEDVIKCGFLRYVQEQKQSGQDLVFPSQSNDNKYGRWGGALGHWYSRYLDKIGLTDPRLSYHSFRFTFKQRCTLCGIDMEVRDALTGHWVSKSTPGRGYMKTLNHQYPFPALVSAIRKLHYAELDLQHLYVDGGHQ